MIIMLASHRVLLSGKSQREKDMYKLVLAAHIELTHYDAGAITFGCLDDRFHWLFEDLVAQLEYDGGFEHTDRVVYAGGGHDIAADQTSSQAALFDQIAKSVELHHTPSVVVTTHEDCGVFGEEAKCGGDRRKQFLFHLTRHREIEEAIVARYSQFLEKVRHFYLSINGVIEFDPWQELTEEDAVAVALAA